MGETHKRGGGERNRHGHPDVVLQQSPQQNLNKTKHHGGGKEKAEKGTTSEKNGMRRAAARPRKNWPKGARKKKNHQEGRHNGGRKRQTKKHTVRAATLGLGPADRAAHKTTMGRGEKKSRKKGAQETIEKITRVRKVSRQSRIRGKGNQSWEKGKEHIKNESGRKMTAQWPMPECDCF